ncbi:hypothetical protein LCGC14_1087280 [marine sediment metagenome]|uniref:Uncharacterized protein n=1 Tax=marine sediment metagenome TaxID=412755 RepID=A0A0F9QJF1_9ZZZZ
MMWIIFIVWFLAWETIALATKEKYFASLSRWTWRKTAWQVTIRFPRKEDWNLDVYFTMRPLRILLFIGMSWATIHLSFGECALGVC